VQNKLAVLMALADRPDGQATLDEVDDEVARLIAEAGERIGNPARFSALDHIDIFQSGLVACEGDIVRITENGRSLLRALDNDRPVDANRPAAIGNKVSAPHQGTDIASDVPAFLVRKFGSGVLDASPHSNLPRRLMTRMQHGANVWRRHLQQDQPPKETRRSGINVERGLLALLSLIVVVSCAGAVAALMQVRSLKSELTTLQRELLPLRERVAKLDQIERTKEVPDKMSDQKNQPSREGRAEEAPLLLSREEIQLVRDYIKPAPVIGPSTAPIGVGDPVTGPTIPFPSPVTERVPKLLGARFAIKNGAIIIVKKDGRQADAVIGPN